MDPGIADQIERFKANLSAFERSLSVLDDDKLLAPLGGWTPREIIAHFIGWNRYVIRGCEQIRLGEMPFYNIEPGQDYRSINAKSLRAYPSKVRGALLRELNESAHELFEYLRTLDPGAWNKDFGVRHDGVVTIRSTVEDLSNDYLHHRDQLVAWKV